MATVHDQDWRKVTEQWYQTELARLRPVLLAMYEYDSSLLELQYTVLEESRRWRGTASKFQLSLLEGEQCLLLLELENMEEQEKDQPLVRVLELVDGECLPIGTVYRLNRLEVVSELAPAKLAALVHAGAVILHNSSELVVCSKAEMTRQVQGVQEKWQEHYGFRKEKEFEFEGERFYRYDSAFSWHY